MNSTTVAVIWQKVCSRWRLPVPIGVSASASA